MKGSYEPVIRSYLPGYVVGTHILQLVLELMVKLDFLIYGPCHAPFFSMATEGGMDGGGKDF